MKKFKKLNETGVGGIDGVVIQIKSYDYLEYRSALGSTKVSVGYDPEKKEIYVYGSQVDTWETKAGVENMPPVAHEKFIADLREGLSLLEGKFIVL